MRPMRNTAIFSSVMMIYDGVWSKDTRTALTLPAAGSVTDNYIASWSEAGQESIAVDLVIGPSLIATIGKCMHGAGKLCPGPSDS